MRIRQYAKAVVAGTVSFCGTLGTALSDGQVSAVEWCGIFPTTVLAVAAVFGISNTAPDVDSAPNQD